VVGGVEKTENENGSYVWAVMVERRIKPRVVAHQDAEVVQLFGGQMEYDEIMLILRNKIWYVFLLAYVSIV